MADEVDLHRRVERGRQAAVLLEDKFFKEAVEKVKDDCWKQFIASKPDDDTGRRYTRAKIDAVEGIIQHVRWYVSDAALAANEIKYEQARKQTVKS